MRVLRTPSGDPFAVPFHVSTVATAFLHLLRNGLWVPAFAGTTSSRRTGERGFALIEILCVLAIIGMLAAIILPSIPRATSRAKLESVAVEAAALLKGDRNAALRRRVGVVTQIDAQARTIRSGASGRVLQVPGDVTFDALLASRCAERPAGRSIEFFPTGMSCGGVIALGRPGATYEVRVNWLTGGVDIVPQKTL